MRACRRPSGRRHGRPACAMCGRCSRTRRPHIQRVARSRVTIRGRILSGRALVDRGRSYLSEKFTVTVMNTGTVRPSILVSE
jgi:hypothetical protein